MTTLLGVVSLLGGVVLALTSSSTKNLPRARVAIGGLLQCLRSSTSLGEVETAVSLGWQTRQR
uniref:Secreted protein n=1 Tax=Oryza punctata TaxID=4537 RepID=A0A0E0MDL9_ORYPU